jgi:hypothetical protein
MSISVKGINGWMKKFTSITKAEVMKKNRILEEKKEKEMEEQNIEEKKRESERIVREDLISSYAIFKDGGEVRDPLNVLYDYLDKNGLVKLSNERKKIIYDQAMNDYKRKHSNPMDIGDYLASKKILSEIEQGSSRVQAMVKVLAKQKALRVIFEDMKELDLTMEEYLKGDA